MTYQQRNGQQFYLHLDQHSKEWTMQFLPLIDLYFCLFTINLFSWARLRYWVIQQQTFHYYCWYQLCSKNSNCYFKCQKSRYQTHQNHLGLLYLKFILESLILIQYLIDHYSLLLISIILLFRCCLSYWCNII